MQNQPVGAPPPYRKYDLPPTYDGRPQPPSPSPSTGNFFEMPVVAVPPPAIVTTQPSVALSPIQKTPAEKVARAALNTSAGCTIIGVPTAMTSMAIGAAVAKQAGDIVSLSVWVAGPIAASIALVGVTGAFMVLDKQIRVGVAERQNRVAPERWSIEPVEPVTSQPTRTSHA